MKFTESHEWIENDGKVGITGYAQKELGEIVYIELPKVGSTVNLGEEIAVLESTKAAADIYSPVSGEILEVNKELKENLSLLNDDPEGKGWLFKIKPLKPEEFETLFSESAYLGTVESP